MAGPEPRLTDVSEDLLALENQVCFGLAVAARSVIALYRPVLEPLNLTHPQYLVMLALWEREPRSVKELSDALQLEPATLSPCSSGWRRTATSSAGGARPTSARWRSPSRAPDASCAPKPRRSRRGSWNGSACRWTTS